MSNNPSYLSFIENLDFVRSSINWTNLNDFKKNITTSLSQNNKYFEDLRFVEDKMKDLLCDDSWMGHCAKYQLQSGGKRFRALLALITADIFKLDKKSAIYAAVCC